MESAPGLVWQRRTIVPLVAGTRVLRIESRPERTERADPMDYLMGKRGPTAGRMTQARFVVTEDGKLQRLRSGR